MLARLATPSPAARTLVEWLSVIPSRAERDLAETLAEGNVGILAEAERSGMLLGGDTTVSLRHELVSRTPTRTLTIAQRLQLSHPLRSHRLGQRWRDLDSGARQIGAEFRVSCGVPGRGTQTSSDVPLGFRAVGRCGRRRPRSRSSGLASPPGCPSRSH